MSRSAGTLVTTYNATFSSPSMLPGYGGHIPTKNFQYGETFGHASQKYFNDYRNEVLNSSKSLYSRGGYFPTSVSNNPEIAINHRRRERDRDLFKPRYELNNYHFDRSKTLTDFYKNTQVHRDQYVDRTGERYPVKEFVLPVVNDKLNESFLPYHSMMLRHKSEINIPLNRNFIASRQPKTMDEYSMLSK